MKKVVLAVLLIALSVFAAHQAEGTKVIVKKGGNVVYETPCGNTEIINPLAKSAHGLVAGADVEVVGVVTVTYDNLKIFDCRYNKDGVEERVKNFPINDYELEFQRVPCVTTCY